MGECLQKDPNLDTLPKRYYPRAKKFAWDPWEATAIRDMRWPGTVGDRNWKAAVLGPVSEFLMKAAHGDPLLFMGLLNGIHLLKPPHALFTPRMYWNALKYGVMGERSWPEPAPELAELHATWPRWEGAVDGPPPAQASLSPAAAE